MPVKKLPYKNIAGVVPCPRGWLVLPGRLHTITVLVEEPFVLPTFADLLDWRPMFDAAAVAAPMGFHDEPVGPYRTCDLKARELVGWGQRNLIHPVPSRAALRAESADEVRRLEPWLTSSDLRSFEWWRQVEAEIAPFHQRRYFSCNPELTYWMLNGEEPLNSSPFDRDIGQPQRIKLVEDRLPGIREIVEGTPPTGATTFHIVQAASLLWSARRIAGRVVNRLPLDPDFDDTGLRMELAR